MEKEKISRAWIYHTEWMSLMGAILACFLFVHNEAVHITERLDGHIAEVNRNFTEIHKRCDMLTKELLDYRKESDERLSDYRRESDQRFYELLKREK